MIYWAINNRKVCCVNSGVSKNPDDWLINSRANNNPEDCSVSRGMNQNPNDWFILNSRDNNTPEVNISLRTVEQQTGPTNSALQTAGKN